MASILDYVEWRGDLTFKEREFNDVDNLILAELAYTDLLGVLENGGLEDTITITEAYKKYKDLGKDQSYLMCNPEPLLEKCAGTVRFGSVRIRDYIDMKNQGAQFQFAAMTFVLDDGSLYVAFRGTDDSLAGWREDLNFSYMEATPAQLSAVEYLNLELTKISRNRKDGILFPNSGENHDSRDEGLPPVRVGGHSKGGNLAIYASAFCENTDRIVTVYSNDGPGFNETIVGHSDYQKVLEKTSLIIPEGSLIGVMLYNKDEKQIVKSTAKGGTKQHNPYSWVVNATGFEQAEKQTSMSLMLDRTLDEWTMRLDNEQKKNFIDILFDTLESSGAKTFTEIYADKWNYYNAIRKAVVKLAPEQLSVLFDVAGQFLAAGKEVIMEDRKSGDVKHDPDTDQ